MSLRLRLAVGLTVVGIVLVLASTVVIRATRADLVERLDDQLRTTARGLPSEPAAGRRGRVPGGEGAADRADRLGADGPSTVWVAVVDAAGGEPIARSAPTTADGERAAPRLSEDVVAELLASPGEARTVSGDGYERFRVAARAAPGRPPTLVGLPLDDVDASVRRLLVVEVAATITVLAVLALVALWVLRLGVRPLQRMTAVAGEIASGDLSPRVSDADPRTEAGQLGVALNQMLARLEAAFASRAASEERLRRFVADASHELRTPITTIRGYAELHRQGGLDDPEQRGAAMRRTEQEAVRMGALVDDLLLLARLDEGRPMQRVPVDLAVVASDTVADARVAHPSHHLEVDLGASDGSAVVSGDDHRLRQVLANLVGNATTHTGPDARIEVTVRGAGADVDRGSVVVTVADDGPGMAPEVAERAFERFARGDSARTRDGGTGLGLAIVESVVAAHGGTIDLRTAPGEGTEVTIRLPAAVEASVT